MGDLFAQDQISLAHHWFKRQAACTPDAIAADTGAEQTSYAELDQRSIAVAQLLTAAGAGPGHLVGIAVRRSVEMLAAVLGALEAGCTYVPLDLNYPPERIALVLEDAAPSMILVDTTTAAKLPSTMALLIDIDAAAPSLDPDPDARSANAIDPESGAYVTFTSGSTGRPKGIVMPHRAVCNLIAWQLQRYQPWEIEHRTLQFASLSFDVSFEEIFSTLGTGGTLVLITEDEWRDVHGLAGLLNKRQVQRLFIPPAALQQVAEGYRAGGVLPHTLKTVICAAEQLVVTDDLRKLFTDLPNALLHNEYGPSETHAATAYTLPRNPATWPNWAPVGHSITHSEVYLLNESLQQVPTGERGEVYIGGLGLARGYLARPGLTAATFVPDLFAENPGARLYRTGDIARRMPHGELEYLSRLDSQVKIRGHRVELSEVHEGLDSHPAVRSSFVFVDGEGSTRRRLIAYLIAHEGSSLKPGELRAFLRRRLPEYMVPVAYIAMDRFPLTVNGKVDQHRLPAPVLTGSAADDPSAEPRDELECELAAAVAELVGAEAIGRDDDFYQLGGYSLLATKLLSTVQNRYSVELLLTEFIKRPTVAGLAEQVRTEHA